VLTTTALPARKTENGGVIYRNSAVGSIHPTEFGEACCFLAQWSKYTGLSRKTRGIISEIPILPLMIHEEIIAMGWEIRIGHPFLAWFPKTRVVFPAFLPHGGAGRSSHVHVHAPCVLCLLPCPAATICLLRIFIFRTSVWAFSLMGTST
jgi:hypothetical protein